MAKREFYVLVEKDGNGGFVGEAPQFRSCIGQGRTLDELMENMRRAIESCLQSEDIGSHSDVVGIYKIDV